MTSENSAHPLKIDHNANLVVSKVNNKSKKITPSSLTSTPVSLDLVLLPRDTYFGKKWGLVKQVISVVKATVVIDSDGFEELKYARGKERCIRLSRKITASDRRETLRIVANDSQVQRTDLQNAQRCRNQLLKSVFLMKKELIRRGCTFFSRWDIDWTGYRAKPAELIETKELVREFKEDLENAERLVLKMKAAWKRKILGIKNGSRKPDSGRTTSECLCDREEQSITVELNRCEEDAVVIESLLSRGNQALTRRKEDWKKLFLLARFLEGRNVVFGPDSPPTWSTFVGSRKELEKAKEDFAALKESLTPSLGDLRDSIEDFEARRSANRKHVKAHVLGSLKRLRARIEMSRYRNHKRAKKLKAQEKKWKGGRFSRI